MQAVIQFCTTYLSGWLGQHIIRDIRVQLFRHLLQLRLKFYDHTPIGRLVTRSISDIETLADVFSEGIAAIAGDFLQLVVILGIMLYTDWRLTLVSLALLPLLLMSTYIFKEKIKDSFNEVRTAVANLNAFVQEHITGMSIVQIFNSEEIEFRKFEAINREHRRANIRSVFYYSVYFPVAEVISAGCTGMLVWYGARGVLAEDITLGVLIAFIMYTSMFFRPIRMIADRFNTLQLGIVSTERILKLLDSQESIPTPARWRRKPPRGRALRARVVCLQRGRLPPPRHQLLGEGRRNRSPGGRHGGRQVVHHQPAEPLLRHWEGKNPGGRRGPEGVRTGRPAPAHCGGVAGRVSLFGHHL
jgi:ATP-binding cassette subfamily B protein